LSCTQALALTRLAKSEVGTQALTLHVLLIPGIFALDYFLSIFAVVTVLRAHRAEIDLWNVAQEEELNRSTGRPLQRRTSVNLGR